MPTQPSFSTQPPRSALFLHCSSSSSRLHHTDKHTQIVDGEDATALGDLAAFCRTQAEWCTAAAAYAMRLAEERQRAAQRPDSAGPLCVPTPQGASAQGAAHALSPGETPSGLSDSSFVHVEGNAATPAATADESVVAALVDGLAAPGTAGSDDLRAQQQLVNMAVQSSADAAHIVALLVRRLCEAREALARTTAKE